MTPADIVALVRDLQESLSALTWSRGDDPPRAAKTSTPVFKVYRGVCMDKTASGWTVYVTTFEAGPDGAWGYTGTAVKLHSQAPVIINLPPDIAEVAYKLADVMVTANDR